MERKTLLYVLELALQYGVPAVLEVVRTWRDDRPITAEDVQKMLAGSRPPEDLLGMTPPRRD